jgi:flagellar basal-body rod protein FlgG
MLRAFSTAATGMTAQQAIVDTIANNIANMNTTGFKRSQVGFQDLMYVKLQEAGAEAAAGVVAPTGFEIGSGVKAASTTKVYTQGEQEKTDRPLDVSIQGDGFFQVTTPGGETRYTRDGSLHVDANGNVVTANGDLLGISVPAGAKSVSIAADGTVSVTTATGTSNVGSILLVRFMNPAGLSSEGNNLLAETAASGSPASGTAGQDGLGMLQQGFLERSNVQMVTELVNLIKAQRAYEINSRAIRAGDEMLTIASQLVR